MTTPGYHHGDLRNALITLALTAVEQDGVEALSLRDMAQALGVSRAAPYRHFKDKDDLLAAVAAQGFDDLGVVYGQALKSPGDGIARLRAVSRAFFTFAAQRPGLYRLMFESDFLNRSPPPAVLLPVAESTYRQLLDAVGGAFPSADEREVKLRTIIMMSTSHGFLSLDHVGRFKPFMYAPYSHADLVEAVMNAAMAGP